MQTIESEGDSIDAAIESALRTLGVTRDRVEVEILSNASRGLFGIGGRKAKVRATVRQPISEQLLEEENAPPAARNVEPTREPFARPQKVAAPPPREPRRRPTTQSRPTAGEPPPAVAVERAEDVLRNIIKHIGVDAAVGGRIDQDAIVLDLTGDSSGVLIGRKGQMLDALEYLVARVVSRDQASAVHVVIDCERYRQRRRESLEDLARRMADEAKRKRRVIKLNAMSPRDRRIVHLVLQQDAAITTRASGKGHFKKLIIIPKGGESSNDTAED